VKGLAPLACKTDRIDAWVLAELTRRDLVPAIWLPDPLVRAERERAHRSSLKQREPPSFASALLHNCSIFRQQGEPSASLLTVSPLRLAPHASNAPNSHCGGAPRLP